MNSENKKNLIEGSSRSAKTDSTVTFSSQKIEAYNSYGYSFGADESEEEKKKSVDAFNELVKQSLDKDCPVLEVIEGMVLDKINDMLDSDTDCILDKLILNHLRNNYTIDAISNLRKRVKKLEKEVESLKKARKGGY